MDLLSLGKEINQAIANYESSGSDRFTKYENIQNILSMVLVALKLRPAAWVSPTDNTQAKLLGNSESYFKKYVWDTLIEVEIKSQRYSAPLIFRHDETNLPIDYKLNDIQLGEILGFQCPADLSTIDRKNSLILKIQYGNYDLITYWVPLDKCDFSKVRSVERNRAEKIRELFKNMGLKEKVKLSYVEDLRFN